ARRRVTCAGGGLGRNAGGGPRRRPHATDPPPRRGAYVPDLRVRVLYLFEFPRLRIEARQAPGAVLRVRTHDAVGRGERVGGHAENPLRPAELRRHRTQRLDTPGAPTVEGPPAGAVGHEKDNTVRRPVGLEARVTAPAGHAFAVTQRAVRQELTHPQFGPVPRHVGVIPGEPRQARAVGTEPRRRVEVVAGNQYFAVAARQRDAHQRVDGFTSRRRVIFADANEPAAAAVHYRVRVAEGRGGRQRLRRGVTDLTVEPLVGKVREIECAVAARESAAAVLVHARARVERRRGHITAASVRGPAYDDAAPAFGRAQLGPVDILAVESDLPEPDRGGDDQVRGDRRLPRPVRRNLGG